MKRVSIVAIVILLFCVGCTIITSNKEDNNKDNNEVTKNEKEKNVYLDYVKELNNVKESDSELPFDISVNYNLISGEGIRYEVTIDNPKEEIKDIEALAIHNKQTDDVFPSIGIFDEKVNLIKGEKPEGVILVGYIPYEGYLDDFECEVKVLVKYKVNDIDKKSYYVTKKLKEPEYDNSGEENES